MTEEILEHLLTNLVNEERALYDKCNPEKKENTLKQLKDIDYIKNVLDKGIEVKTSDAYRKFVSKDIEKKMKESGASKSTSKKFKEKYWNKYHYLKWDNCHLMYVMYGKKGEYTITYMERIATPRGSLYIIANGEDVSLIHYHVLERYEERAGLVSNDRLEAIKWLLKEFNHTTTKVCDPRPEHGFILEDAYAFLASGVLLGNTLRGYLFLKTYIPLEMMNEQQDEMHEVAWNAIDEGMRKRKRNAPVM